MKFVVSEEEHGEKLLSFLQGKYPNVSLRTLKKWLEQKHCLLNGRVEVFSTRKLAEKDVVQLTVVESKKESLSLKILWEDKDLLVINKPPGLVSSDSDLRSLLPNTSFLVHRLDKETSGVLVLAKHLVAKQKLEELFQTRKIRKYYIALVCGRIARKQGKLDTFLAKKREYQGQSLYESSCQGKRAITSWQVLEQNDRAALILCEIHTGRTHQIRVHMSEIGHPLVGEEQYAGGKKTMPVFCNRHLLHASSVVFIHPFTGKEISVQAPLPEDFLQALQELGFKGGSI